MDRSPDRCGDRGAPATSVAVRRAISLALIASVSTAAAAGPAYTVEAETVWHAPLLEAGRCSPRAADLNADGTDDVVLGGGVEDHWGEVVALDGRTGDVLWSRRLPDDVLVALPLLDVDRDRVPDVFVGGRSRLRGVHASSGRDGRPLWRLDEANPQATFPPINFVNLLLVGDRSGDGRDDLLVVQSGGKDTRRIAARFHWVDSADGSLLETLVAPDGKESYSLPLVQQRPGERPRFYVGTGGETLSGNLLRLRPPAFAEEWRVRAIGGGFVGSPALVDLDRDGADEIVASDMPGAVYRIDAETGAVGWRWRERPRWTYVSPAAGSFGGDATLDVVAGVNRGVFPESAGADVLWLDGASGRVLSRRSFDERTTFAASSPLVLDLDGDGRDEVLIVLTDDFLDPATPGRRHRLLILDGGDDRRPVLDLELEGDSIATPRLADLDGDGRLDLVHASRHGALRLELSVSGGVPGAERRPPRVRWGEMRGGNGQGIYASQRGASP